MRKGFTLIEVLVSLVILSIIAIISSNILQSSLETERVASKRLNDVTTSRFSILSSNLPISLIVYLTLSTRVTFASSGL